MQLQHSNRNGNCNNTDINASKLAHATCCTTTIAFITTNIACNCNATTTTTTTNNHDDDDDDDTNSYCNSIATAGTAATLQQC